MNELVNTNIIINPLKELHQDNIKKLLNEYNVNLNNLSTVKNLIVTKDNYKNIKNLKFEIKRFRDNIEQNRKNISSVLDRIKKELMVIEKEYDPTIEIIDSKIKEIENIIREERKKEILDYCKSELKLLCDLDYISTCNKLNFPTFDLDSWTKTDTAFKEYKEAVKDHIKNLYKLNLEYTELFESIDKENDPIIVSQKDYLLRDFLNGSSIENIKLKIENIKLKNKEREIEEKLKSTIIKKSTIIDSNTGEILEEKSNSSIQEVLTFQIILNYSSVNDKNQKIMKLNELIEQNFSCVVKII